MGSEAISRGEIVRLHGHLQTVELNTDTDTLVVQALAILTPARRTAIAQRLRNELGLPETQKVLVLDAGVTLGILKRKAN